MITRLSPGSYRYGPDIVIVRLPDGAWSVGNARTGEGYDAFLTLREAKAYAARVAHLERGNV